MAKSNAQRSREWRQRQKARRLGVAGNQAVPSAASDATPAAGVVKRPLAEKGTCGLFQDQLAITIADGEFAYTMQLSPNEALGLGLRLLQQVGVRVELTPGGE